MRRIDADKLKESILTNFHEHFSHNHDSDQTYLIEIILNCIEESETVQPRDTTLHGVWKEKWISVKDRMPELMKWVLGYCVSGSMEIVRYDHVMDDWDSMLPNHGYMKGYITHWMPLPEPPVKEA